jgi:hypothetical protein
LFRDSASFAVVKLGSEFKNAKVSKDMSINLNLDLAVLKREVGLLMVHRLEMKLLFQLRRLIDQSVGSHRGRQFYNMLLFVDIMKYRKRNFFLKQLTTVIQQHVVFVFCEAL